MGRSLTFIYGIVVYVIFLATFLYSIGFVGNVLVPKSIDSGAQGPIASSLIINLVLLSVFALQHSIMARPAFKRLWTTVIPQAAERSTYILMTSGALIMIFAFWQPLPAVVWDVRNTVLGTALTGLFWGGWLVVLASTFMIDHFDLFGLKQVCANLKKRQPIQLGFMEVGLYRFMRHPIMTGFLIAFWTAPTMTVGHLLFTLVTSGYIVIAVLRLEERDLIAQFGEDYITYQNKVPAFLPRFGRGAAK
ncbi:methanethiol S-methyltransferase [Neptunicoccus sediminis]|uniref:methanethiol S-methyltransferase n=1 Tax=Neptunicoccus sediminis TaxID=1892596 RepID=UPI000845F46C|nr:methanethiol S-methyltransferase [Neptunicoccus sediminis]